MPTFLRVKNAWLAQSKALYNAYQGDHVILGAQENAGYHKRVTLVNQTTTPLAVEGLWQLFGTSTDFNLQSGESPYPVFPIRANPSPNSNSIVRTVLNPTAATIDQETFTNFIYVVPIIGTPLTTVIVNTFVGKSTWSNKTFTGAYNIPYQTRYNNSPTTGVLTFSTIISAFSTTMPTTTDAGQPIWGMTIFNSNFSGTASVARIGAYRSSCVIYVNNKLMVGSDPRHPKPWTTVITGIQ